MVTHTTPAGNKSDEATTRQAGHDDAEFRKVMDAEPLGRMQQKGATPLVEGIVERGSIRPQQHKCDVSPSVATYVDGVCIFKSMNQRNSADACLKNRCCELIHTTERSITSSEVAPMLQLSLLNEENSRLILSP